MRPLPHRARLRPRLAIASLKLDCPQTGFAARRRLHLPTGRGDGRRPAIRLADPLRHLNTLSSPLGERRMPLFQRLPIFLTNSTQNARHIVDKPPTDRYPRQPTQQAITCPCPDGGIGRRTSFRCWRSQGRGGSSPLLGTICSPRQRPGRSSKRLVLQHFSTENRPTTVRADPPEFSKRPTFCWCFCWSCFGPA